MRQTAAGIRNDVAATIKPSVSLSISEAAASDIRIKYPSGIWGPWDPEVAPYMREPMDLIDSRRYRSVIFAGPARTGKTIALIDIPTAYIAAYKNADALVVQMTKDKATEFSKKRLTPMLENTPLTRAKLSPSRHDNNVLSKVFKTGTYLGIGYPAKSVLSGSDYQYALLTDYDKHKPDVGGEGSSFKLASKRTTTFGSRGMTVCEGSPGFEVIDPDWESLTPHEAPPTFGILTLYNKGDRRKIYWPCPDCGEYFEASFEQLVWDNKQTDLRKAAATVTMCCPHCGSADIPPSHKNRLIQNHIWVPDGMTVTKSRELLGERVPTDTASFWMEGPAAAYQTWENLVYEYLTALRTLEQTGDEQALKSTVNVDIGRPFKRPEAVENLRDILRARAIIQEQSVVPEWVRFTVATVDVQAGKNARFDVMIHGFDEQMRHTVIDAFYITDSERNSGDKKARVNPAANPEDWLLLIQQVIKRDYQTPFGFSITPQLTAIDSGGEDGVTDNAYEFFRHIRGLHLSSKVILVKGASHKPATLITESYPDSTKKKNRKVTSVGDVPLQILDTDAFKDAVQNTLKREDDGPGYCVFPQWLPRSFYRGLTAETRGIDGKWRRKGKTPNEPLDHFVYARACWRFLGAHNVNWSLPPMWARPLAQQKPQETPMQTTKRRSRYV